MTDQRDRNRPSADHDRAPESDSAWSASGPGRHNDSAEAGKRVLNIGGVLCLSLAVCVVLAELFERIGWHQAAGFAAWLFRLLALFGFPPLGVYIVVKVVRGEIQW